MRLLALVLTAFLLGLAFGTLIDRLVWPEPGREPRDSLEVGFV